MLPESEGEEEEYEHHGEEEEATSPLMPSTKEEEEKKKKNKGKEGEREKREKRSKFKWAVTREEAIIHQVSFAGGEDMVRLVYTKEKKGRTLTERQKAEPKTSPQLFLRHRSFTQLIFQSFQCCYFQAPKMTWSS